MTEHEYEATQAMILQCARIISGPALNLDAFIAAINKADAFGPIADPTLYRKAGGNMQQIEAIATALRRCRNDIKEPLEKLTDSAKNHI